MKKLLEILGSETASQLPVSFQFIAVKEKNNLKIVNKYVPVKKYKSLMCPVSGSYKPISKIK